MQVPDLSHLSPEVRRLYWEIRTEIAWIRVRWALRDYLASRHWKRFHPDQPRVPAGQPEGGRWTSGDGGHVNLVAGPSGQSGYPIDISADDQIGGHTFETHVGKSESYLKGRLTGSQRLAKIIGVGEKRAGSFSSLETANKLVSAMAYQNASKINAWLHSNSLLVPRVLYVDANFTAPTGYEAYVPNAYVQPRMRPTFAVGAVLVRTKMNSRGYYVETAYPMNKD